MHVPFPVSVPGAESIRPEEFTVGTSLQRNVNAYDDIEFDDTQLQDQANSYRIYINLVARTLRDVPFIKNLSISAELFTFFFENCLADGDIVSAKM